MKKFFSLNVKIRLSAVIFFSLIVLCAIVFFWYLNGKDPKILAILGSLFAGIIVALIQFLIAWQDYLSTEKLKDLKIKRVLINRDQRDFYEGYVRSAQKNIDMMGVTGIRFMEHFANDDSDAPENSKVLLQAMSKGVNVRILIPKVEFLSQIDDQRNFKSSLVRYQNIASLYPTKFQVKYFSHVPAHSIFMVDEECIIGPVFPDVSSKFTPALHLLNNSPFAEKYLKYFNDEWKSAESL